MNKLIAASLALLWLAGCGGSGNSSSAMTPATSSSSAAPVAVDDFTVATYQYFGITSDSTSPTATLGITATASETAAPIVYAN